MKKKLVSTLLAVSMVAALCAGCGNNGEDKEESKESGSAGKTLEVWVPPLDDDTVNNWGGLMGDWEKENDCTVNITVVPWEKYE